MSNIVIRTITGAVFITIVLFPLFWMKEAAAAVLGLFMFLSAIEFFQMFSKNEEKGVSWELSSGITLIIFGVITFIIFEQLPSAAGIFIIPLIFIYFMIEFWRNKGRTVYNIAITLMGILYILLPFLLLIDFHVNDNAIFPGIAGMFILIWMNDTFAYLSGRFFGKHKLIERISPNKTWEGTIGGIIFTILAGYFVGLLFDPDNTVFWALSSLILAPCSVLGDLFESLIKRSQNVKDSGKILPGHGGILDRFDAAIFAAPFFVAWSYCYSYICL